MKKLFSIFLALAMVLSLASALPMGAVSIDTMAFKPVSNGLTLYRLDMVGYGDYSITPEINVTIAELEASAQSVRQQSYTDYAPQSVDNADLYGRSAIASMDRGTVYSEAYDRLDTTVRARLESVDLSDFNLTPDEIALVYFAYHYDRTECFWLNNGFNYSLYEETGTVAEMYPWYIFSVEELPTAKAKFDAAVDELLDGIDMSLGEFEREKKIHDRIILKAEYDYPSLDDPTDYNAHSAYGCIVEGECVCEGYAKAFVYLARRVGIQSFIATGVGGNEAHAWNYVKINGNFYHTDLTWDDLGDNNAIPLYYDYFNLTDEDITARDHTIENTFGYPLPKCVAIEDEFFNHYNARVTEYNYDDFVRIAKTSRLVLPGRVIVYYAAEREEIDNYGVLSIEASKIAEEIGITGYKGIDLYIYNRLFVLRGDTSALGGGATIPDRHGYCGGEGDGTNLSWALTGDGVLKISGAGKMKDYTMFEHSPWYSNATDIVSVEFDGNITSIGDYAFGDCENLTSIDIPDSVTSIGAAAFEFCKSITSIIIPDGITSIMPATFQGCVSLNSVKIPNSVTSIEGIAFNMCFELTSIEIPDSVTSIGAGAFDQCFNLPSITVGSANPAYCTVDGVLFTKDKTWLVCYPAGKQTTLYRVPDSVTSIERWAFGGCRYLTAIEIPSSVASIWGQAFSSCIELTDIYCEAESKPEGWVDRVAEDWDDSWLGGCDATVHWGYDFDSEETVASGYCGGEGDGTNLSWKLTAKGTLTISGKGTMQSTPDFADKTRVRTVVIENGATSIGAYAFENCKNLAVIEIPDSITSIGDYAFNYCFSLTDVTIPNSVTSIGERAFQDCISIESIAIPDSITSIAIGTFCGCTNLIAIEIPKSVTNIGELAFTLCTGLASIVVDNENPAYCSVDNVLFDKDKTRLICYSARKQNTSYSIFRSVTSIDMMAFCGCSNLVSIEIPKSVSYIGYATFDECNNLTDIYCEAESQPERWTDYWLGNCSAAVHWGYKIDPWEPGDFDGDGVVTMKDAVYYIGWIGAPFLPQYQINHDVNLDFNKDGKYTMADAVYFIGWIGAPFLPQYKIEW